MQLEKQRGVPKSLNTKVYRGRSSRHRLAAQE
jgi:hypothetical protein